MKRRIAEFQLLPAFDLLQNVNHLYSESIGVKTIKPDLLVPFCIAHETMKLSYQAGTIYRAKINVSANVAPKKAVAEVFLRPILPQQSHVFQLFENKLNKLPVNFFVSRR